MKTAAAINLEGIIQGVGFRPFVHRLADRFRLSGFVLNTSAGVMIHAESDRETIGLFLKALTRELPPLARITKQRVRFIRPLGLSGFSIKISERSDKRSALVSPDIGICDECLAELKDPRNRRYAYPFINCTNCGPRFSIIQNIPYDRPLTTMKAFNMCVDCATEYTDIRDRRYHAQPNACSVCGPQAAFIKNGKTTGCGQDAVAEAIRHLRAGSIIAVKGLGGFHIACDAHNIETIRRLRTLKKRPSKPFALMVPDIKTARAIAEISEPEENLLRSPERPIVLLRKKNDHALWQELCPDNNYLGIMLCYTPLHHMLFSRAFSDGAPLACLVMSSANIADDPIEIENAQAIRNLSGICEAFLTHNRDIWNRVDDSIAQIIDGKPVALRRSRGYAPFPFFLKKKMEPTLACGAELKNTFCLAKDGRAFLSPYIGDLKTYATYQFYREAVTRLKKLFCVKPALIAHDLHPDYLSTHYALAVKAKNRTATLVGVQHHHAHCASVIAEHGLKGKVIGVCFDGVGYGSDGKIWGGEFFHGSLSNIKRYGHFEYVPMPGGDKATKEPLRMAISYLYQAFGENIYRLDIGFINKFQSKLSDFITVAKLHPVLTSSAGRLFDAISAILGICDIITYEAQAAVKLQMFAERSETKKAYHFTIREENNMLVIGSRRALEQIVSDLRGYVSREDIARGFHNGLADVTARMCAAIRKKTSTGAVCLSGGVFQNKLLLELTARRLRKAKFTVYYNEVLPANDGAIALGQTAIANAKR
ncbi:MAG: carbamoyltransferase HypF [Candidatus Omnitrophota bacterium]